MPKQSDSKHKSRRKEILTGCVECFAKKGFHHTSMRDLSEELGMSLGGLYTYFRSKEEIIKDFIADDRSEAQAMFDVVRPEMTFWEGLEKLIEVSTRTMAQPQARKVGMVWMQINAEAMINPEVSEMVSQHYDYVTAHLTELVKAGQARGELRTDFDAVALTRILISLADGLSLRELLCLQADTEGDLELFVRLVRATLGTPTTPVKRKGKRS